MRKAALFILSIPLLLFLFSASAGASPPPQSPLADVGGPQMELHANLEYFSDIANSGSAVPLTVVVLDQHDAPVNGALVEIISYPEGEAFRFAGETDLEGRVSTEFSAAADAETEFRLMIKVTKDCWTEDSTELSVTVFPKADLRIGPDLSLAMSALMMATFLSTEAGKWGAFKAVVFPLYTRLKKDEVLDHFVRGQIYGYIMSHPGKNYNSIRNELNMTNGTLSHHLRTLEVQGFVKSRRDGINTRFYPIDMQVPQENGVRLSDLQAQIMEIIRKNDGMTQTEIAERLHVSQQCISYNLRYMRREGIIGMEKAGRERKYFMMNS